MSTQNKGRRTSFKLSHYLSHFNNKICALDAIRVTAPAIVMEKHIFRTAINTTGTSKTTSGTSKTTPGTSRNTADTSRIPSQTSARTTSEPQSVSKTRESFVEWIVAKINKDKDLKKGCKPGKWNKFEGKPKASVYSLVFSSFDALWVIAHDFSSWTRLYGLGGAITIQIFGKKSIWKTQLEMLNSSHQLEGLGSHGGGSRIGGSGDPGGPGSMKGGGGGEGGGGSDDPDRPDVDSICDQAAQEFKNLIQVESSRISLSVCFSYYKILKARLTWRQGSIIAAIATAALVLPDLSKSHWVARAFWISSLVTALLAVYYAGNLVWKVGRLFSGFQIRAWIRNSNKGILDIIRDEISGISMLRMLIPALSAVLAVSAPGVLLSAAVVFLLLGFGIYLGFTWTRVLDTDAGKGDSRDVFIVYLVVLAVFYIVYTLSDVCQDYGTDATVRGAIERSIDKVLSEWPKFIQAREEQNMQQQQNRELQQQQLAIWRDILRVNTDNRNVMAEIGAKLLDAQIKAREEQKRQDAVGPDESRRPQPAFINREIEQVVRMSTDFGKRSALWCAAWGGHSTIVKLLLYVGVSDIGSTDCPRQTPLLCASENGHEVVVKLLLETGRVDVNSKDYSGQTPLLCAVKEGHEAVVELLLQTGEVDLDSKDDSGWTPILIAAKNGHERIVQLLLEAGRVDVNSKDPSGRTPLVWAKLFRYDSVVKLLLDAGGVLGIDLLSYILSRVTRMHDGTG